MGFGRNPHVQKAQSAEEKAQLAEDTASEVRAWLEAAHLWERAADREQPGKKRTEYLASAAAARVRSDNPTAREGSLLQRAAPRLRLVHPAGET
jgi:hypothetical protein